MKKLKLFLTIVGSSLTLFSSNAQCTITGALVNENYSVSSSWTFSDFISTLPTASNCYDQSNGSMNVSSNQMNFITSRGSLELRAYKSIPTLSNSSWTSEFQLTILANGAMATNSPGVYVAAFTEGNQPIRTSCSLSAISSFPGGTCGTYPSTNMNAIWVMMNSTPPSSCASGMGAISLVAQSRQGNGAIASSSSINLSGAGNYYIRLERIGATNGQLSVYSDALHTALIGSTCFDINPDIVNLNTLQHGVVEQGSDLRIFNGSVSNMKIDNATPCATNFDATFWAKIANGQLSVNSVVTGGTHVWKVYSIANGTFGQYTHLGTYTTPTFSLDIANTHLCYYVTHSIQTECGEACAAQIICGAECDEKECNLTPPTGLTVSRVGGQDFLSWNPVPGAISYTVEITPNDPRCCGQIDPGGDGWISAPLVFSNIFGTSHTVDNHTFEAGPGDVILTCYSWRVIAKCPDGGTVSSASTCSNGSAPGGSGTFIDKSNTGSVGPLSPEESSRLTIYPNPTNGMISFEVKTEKEDVYTVTITDLAGKKIESFEQMKTNDRQLTITWDTASLVAGEYLVTIVNSANEIMVKKFIKE